MMAKKAQAAMEFLMTYGWAIVVIIAVVSILFYLGIFSPFDLASNNCAMPSGFSCYSFTVYQGGSLVLDIGQSTGRTILVNRVACDEGAAAHWTDVNESIESTMHGSIENVTCYNSDGTTPQYGDVYHGNVYIEYTDIGTGYTHHVQGEISFTVIEHRPTPTPSPTPGPVVITSCPFTVNTGERYVLESNLTCSGGIEVTGAAANSTIDCMGHSLTGGSGDGIRLSSVSGVQVMNCVVLDFASYGIHLDRASGSNITGNWMQLNGAGLVLENSDRNSILGNSITENRDYSVWISGSSDNIISGNYQWTEFDGFRITQLAWEHVRQQRGQQLQVCLLVQ